jgi:hypothetical protein
MKTKVIYGAANCPRCDGSQGQSIDLTGYWLDGQRIDGAPNYRYHSEGCNCTPRYLSLEEHNAIEAERLAQWNESVATLGYREALRQKWITTLARAERNLRDGDMDGNADACFELIDWLNGEQWERVMLKLRVVGCHSVDETKWEAE